MEHGSRLSGQRNLGMAVESQELNRAFPPRPSDHDSQSTIARSPRRFVRSPPPLEHPRFSRDVEPWPFGHSRSHRLRLDGLDFALQVTW